MMSAPTRLAAAIVGVIAIAASVSGVADAKEKFVYGLSWLPQAEHCGFFQAKAAGLYDEAGIDVELLPGGPGINLAQLVAAGRVDAGMGIALSTLNMRANNIPGITVAAMFQKSPQTLVAHPNPALKTIEDLKSRKIAVANFSRTQFWLWLKNAYGFDDAQLRPYAYNPAGFIADKAMVQQGYITEDDFFIGRALGSPLKLFLLADYGYPDYATSIYTTESVIEKRRPALQAFVDASIKGWSQCVRGNPMPAFEAIKAMHPEQSIELSTFKIEQMRKHGFIDGGDAATFGIGAMTDARWAKIFDVMSTAGAYEKNLDYRKAYTLDFVNKKMGM